MVAVQHRFSAVQIPDVAVLAACVNLAVGVVADPHAPQSERFVCTIGLDASAAAPSLFEAVWLAIDELNNQEVGG